MSPAHRGEGAIRVLYVGGLGRSGSTLLDIVLGQLPGFFSAGEIRDLWKRGVRENRLCGCGTPFRECPFWSQVGKEAFGGWTEVDVDGLIALAAKVDRHAMLPLLVRPGLWPAFDRNVQEYLQTLHRLYEAIHVVGDTRVIIDSSKAPSSAFLLRQLASLDLRLVHLVRDPRGVAHSWNKQVVRPDTPGRTVYMHRYHPGRIGARWLTRNLMVELLRGLGVPEIRVRYESMVEDPRGEIARVARFAGEAPGPDDLSFISGRAVTLRPNHTVMGNPLRLRSGPLALRMDFAWRTEMSRTHRTMVTSSTWPLLRRYGYAP